MLYDIISTGSKGNAVLLCGKLLIDCGVSFKMLAPYVPKIKLVFITHEHGDHLNKRTIKKLASENPSIRWACGEWLADKLAGCGVQSEKIDVVNIPKIYDYGSLMIAPIKLYHDVKCFGLRIFEGKEKAIFITDTATVDGIEAKNYDLYFVEANYTEADLRRRIAEKEARGEFVYEYRVPYTHLSKEQADDFIYSNIGKKGQYLYLHEHEDR